MQPFDTTRGDRVANPFAANGVPGEIVHVRTNAGRSVAAWRPNPPIRGNPQRGYFCHGFSLSTFAFPTAPDAGYSVLSGEGMAVVLADEYMKLGVVRGPGPAPAGPQPRDLIVWWLGNDPVHSALIDHPAVDLAGKIDLDRTLVSSKTGTGIVRIRVPLAVVVRDYRTANLIELYRRVG